MKKISCTNELLWRERMREKSCTLQRYSTRKGVPRFYTSGLSSTNGLYYTSEMQRSCTTPKKRRVSNLLNFKLRKMRFYIDEVDYM